MALVLNTSREVLTLRGGAPLVPWSTATVDTTLRPESEYLAAGLIVVLADTPGPPVAASVVLGDLVWCGAYDATKVYSAGQLVTASGASYICLQTSYAHAPASSPTYWVALGGAGGGGIYTVTTAGNLGAAYSFSPGAGLTTLKGTLNANCALTITSPSAGYNIVLELTQDGTGGRTLTIDGTSVDVPASPGATFLLWCLYDGADLVVALFGGFTGSVAGGDLSGTYPAPTVAKLNGVVASSYVTLTGTQTLANKRVSNRVVTVTQSATPTINTDNTDVASITGLAQAITSMTTNLSGTPGDFDPLMIRITDNGTARAISWGASFEASTVALPTTTVISTMLCVQFVWNAVTSKWRVLGVA